MNSSQQQAGASFRRRNATRSPHVHGQRFLREKDAPSRTRLVARRTNTSQKGVEFGLQVAKACTFEVDFTAFRASTTSWRHEFVTAASGRVCSPAQRETLATRAQFRIPPAKRRAARNPLHCTVSAGSTRAKSVTFAAYCQQTAPLKLISTAFRAENNRLNTGFVTATGRRVVSPAQRSIHNTRAARGFLRQNDAPGRFRLVALGSSSRCKSKHGQIWPPTGQKVHL